MLSNSPDSLILSYTEESSLSKLFLYIFFTAAVIVGEDFLVYSAHAPI